MRKKLSPRDRRVPVSITVQGGVLEQIEKYVKDFNKRSGFQALNIPKFMELAALNFLESEKILAQKSRP